MSQLSKSDKEWLSRQIAAQVESSVNVAIDAFKPHGWRQVTHFIREWSLAGTSVTVFVALLALAGSQFYYANQRVKEEATFESKTTDDLKKIDEHLKGIDAALATSRIEQAAANPADENSAVVARKALESARVNLVQLPSDLVRKDGQKFIEVTKVNPEAWNAAIGFLNYKSFLNNASLSVPPNTGAAFVTRYNSVPLPEGEKDPQMAVSGVAPEESAAKYDLIGHDSNKSQPLGTKYIFDFGGTVVLDGMQFRNVVFRNTKIIYRGGPVQMTNVFFINCTFDMKLNENSHNLALAILEPAPSTTFSGA
jgi:hypothetical protein